VPTKDGRIALSPMLDKNGHFKSDMTVTRIGDGEYFCVTASIGKRHDHHWMMMNMPEDGSVCFQDITYQTGCLVLAGPKSREVLTKACYDDVSNDVFPFGTSREIFVGRVKCRVNRMNYVGELGYEIFHPIESQIPVFQTLMAAGKAFDLKMFGMYAMDSMRLEKGYLGWKSEMNVQHTPLETNVAWTVKMDKDFIGMDGLEKQKAAGIQRRLVCLVCAAEAADPWGYNPIFSGDRIIGMTSSGGYGHRIGKSIALGYVTPDLAMPGTKLEVEVLGRKLPAEVVSMPLYDPKNEKMKA
jgi:dimethylglycine dehydrogenase